MHNKLQLIFFSEKLLQKLKIVYNYPKVLHNKVVLPFLGNYIRDHPNIFQNIVTQ